MDAQDLGALLLEIGRYALLANAVIGAILLAGLVIWADDFRAWVEAGRSRDRGGH